MNRKRILVLHILWPLAIGTLIYCLASPDRQFFLRLARNYLPDMMWGYSLVFSLFCIIGNNAASIGKVLGMAFPFSAAMEMAQKASFVPGTFDVFDIAVEFLSEAIAACIIYKLYAKEDF